MTPEEQVREQIHRLLTASGWIVQDAKDANVYSPSILIAP